MDVDVDVDEDDTSLYTSSHVIPMILVKVLEAVEHSYDRLKYNIWSPCVPIGNDKTSCETILDIEGSDAFCKAREIGIPIEIGGNTGKGFFSSAGPLLYGGDKIFAVDVSLNHNVKNFMVDYFEVIAKGTDIDITNDQKWPIYEKVFNIKAIANKDSNDLGYRYSSFIMSDPLYEAFVGSLLSILYEYGVCPSIPKYVSFYACPGDRQHSHTFVLQKSDITFVDFINGELLSQVTVYDIIMLIFQVAHAFAMMKLMFGITHYDAHLGNVMITYTKEVLHNKSSRSAYGGKDLSKVDYIRYHIPVSEKIDGVEHDVILNIENNGLLAKVIDYGFTYTDFGKSTLNKELPFRFFNRWETYNMSGVLTGSLPNSSVSSSDFHDFLPFINTYDDGDFNYFFKIFVVRMFKMATSGPAGMHHSRILRDPLFKLFTSFVTNGEFDIDDAFNGSGNLRNFADKPNRWGYNERFTSGRNTGAVTPLVNIVKALNLLGCDKVIDKGFVNIYINRQNLSAVDLRDKEVITVCNPINTYKTESIVYDIFSEYKSFFDKCVIDDRGNRKVCDGIKTNINAKDPNNVIFYDFYNNFVKPTEMTSIATLRGLNRIKSPGYKSYNVGKFLFLHKVRILPRTQDMSIKQMLRYKPTHRVFNYLPPPDELMYRPLENVTLNLIYVKPSKVKGRAKRYNDSLYNIAEAKIQTGLVINGGYFIVKDNLNNILTLHEKLENEDLNKPIGYYYNVNDSLSGTRLPFPYHYDNSLAVVCFDPEGKLFIMKSNDFKRYHELVEHTYHDMTPNGNIIASVKKNVIKMTDGPNKRPVLSANAPTGFKYNSAIETGPVLIWDGVVTFDDKSFNEEFISSESTSCKVDHRSVNSMAFYNEPGEKCFLYGQRHSNSFMIHNVLCITNEGDILVANIEGRGYDAIGLDRAQVAELLLRFGVKYAVSLDGGFSAGAVIKDKDSTKWVTIDPRRRSVSTSIMFEQK